MGSLAGPRAVDASSFEWGRRWFQNPSTELEELRLPCVCSVASV